MKLAAKQVGLGLLAFLLVQFFFGMRLPGTMAVLAADRIMDVVPARSGPWVDSPSKVPGGEDAGPGKDAGPVEDADPVAAQPESESATGKGHAVAGLDGSVAAGLVAIYQLLDDDRPAEAYQTALASLAAMPDSPQLHLAAGYAAMVDQRCWLAERHLRHASMQNKSRLITRRRDLVLAECHGPWSRSMVFTTSIGYRPSLVDRAMVKSLRAEPSSDLHEFCKQLAGLCNPETPFRVTRQPDNGVDLWTQITLPYRHNAGGHWQYHHQPDDFQPESKPQRLSWQGVFDPLWCLAIQ